MKKSLGLLLPKQFLNSDLSHILSHIQKDFNVEIIGEDIFYIHITGVVFLDKLLCKLGLVYNKFLTFIFFAFTQKPFFNNFLLMLLFRLENERNVFKKYLFYFVSGFKSSFISYDFYLNFVIPFPIKNHEKYDYFLAFTEFSNDSLIKFLLNKQSNLVYYVYSWDHIYKFLRFSNQFQYLVWNAHIKDKLKETFKIANIYVSGTSQFDYIYEHKNNGVKIEANKKYVYFCLSTGLEKLVIRELNVIIELAKFLSHNDIDVLVRPYPLFRGNYYDYIVDFPSNLFFEKIEIGANLNLHDKVEKISNAICVIHTGSTIGIESFLLGTPSFLFVDDNISSDAVSLKNFALQQQNLDFYFSSNYFIINGISDFFKILDICSFELDKSVNYFKNNFFKFNSQILLDSFSRNV